MRCNDRGGLTEGCLAKLHSNLLRGCTLAQQWTWLAREVSQVIVGQKGAVARTLSSSLKS